MADAKADSMYSTWSQATLLLAGGLGLATTLFQAIGTGAAGSLTERMARSHPDLTATGFILLLVGSAAPFVAMVLNYAIPANTKEKTGLPTLKRWSVGVLLVVGIVLTVAGLIYLTARAVTVQASSSRPSVAAGLKNDGSTLSVSVKAEAVSAYDTVTAYAEGLIRAPGQSGNITYERGAACDSSSRSKHGRGGRCIVRLAPGRVDV